jgi:hypothetical protein
LIYSLENSAAGRARTVNEEAMKTLAALMLIAVAGCSVADFDVTRAIPSETIAGTGSLPSATSPDTAQPLDVPLHQVVDSSSTGFVNSIYLSDLTLDIHSTGDWSFVQSMDLYIASTMSGTTLPKVVVASASAPGAVTKLNLAITPDVDLVPYINEGAVLTATATGTQPSHDVTLDGQFTLHVHPL